MTDNADNYTPVTVIAAEGARIGITTCLRCGAAIVLTMAADARAIHDAWHATYGTENARTEHVPDPNSPPNTLPTG